MEQLLESAGEEFLNIFGEKAECYGIAPGRVEVLGNHTDYNDGLALAAAIDRSVAVVGRPIPGGTSKVYSLTFKSGSSFSADNPEPGSGEHWLDYIMGVAWQLRKSGRAPGAFEAVVAGNVPLGSGLSSSAAMEMAAGNFMKAMRGFGMDAMDMARNCRAAENDFVGVPCGILDQWASAMGEKGKLLLLDCRALEILDRPTLPDHARLVVADTNSPRSLAAGDYNRRRESCFRAARICAGKFPDRNITHLRDVSPEMLAECENNMADEDFRRARHVVNENARARAGAEMLRSGDVAGLGRLLSESHASSRADFENSGSGLDAMADAAAGIAGCHGSRLTGGGFGGATVNLVETAETDRFIHELKIRYQAKTGMKADVHAFTPSGGASGGVF